MNALEISTQRERLDLDFIHTFLTNEARWCQGIPREVVEKSIHNSLCFGAYFNGKQIAFARVVTDYATFGNLVDVFVSPEFQSKGVARKLLEAVVEHPELTGLRRFMLATSDKQTLYSKFGFDVLNRPDIFMEIFRPDVYR